MYEVNENQTEYFRSSVDGKVIPLRPAGTGQPAAATASAGAPVILQPHFHVNGEMSAFDRWELDKWWDAALERNMEKISRGIGSMQ